MQPACFSSPSTGSVEAQCVCVSDVLPSMTHIAGPSHHIPLQERERGDGVKLSSSSLLSRKNLFTSLLRIETVGETLFNTSTDV